MFTDHELETIEDIILNYGDEWAENSIERRTYSSILDKIDQYLNG